jgi:PQQ-like domain
VSAPRTGARRGRSLLAALAGLCLASACGTGPSPRASKTTHPTTTVTTTTAAPATGSSAPPTSGAAATPSAAWTTYGGSFTRTSVDTTSPSLAHGPTEAWTSPPLDGTVYGEPLIFDGQVFVGTENGTVYDLAASSGSVLWSDHLATPVPSSALPCGDISPTVGITSTMVIDPSRNELFASSARYVGATVEHWVYAIDLSDHAVAWSRDVDQPGWTAAAQLQRTGLALSAGHVIVSFGGNYGDCGFYHGWVIGVPESGSGSLLAYEVPTAREGAVWAPAGVSVNAAGDVYAVTGNGAALPGQPFDFGDAVIELSPQLTELQYFAPTTWAQDNADDLDLSSTAAILLGTNQLFIVGKEQIAYLLDAGGLRGIGGQVASVPVCNSRGGNAYLAPDVYVVCPDDGTVVQVRVGAASLTRGWTWTSPTGGASSPTIAGGVLWSVDLGASVLYGVSLSTGATVFRTPLDTGTPPHFAAPSAAGGLLVVAGSRAVEAFR